MPRFTYEDADKYGSSGGRSSYFSLKDDGDTAEVHLLGNDMNDFPGYAVHRVPIGDGYRYVNCLREAGAPIDDCPFCKDGRNDPDIRKVHAKLFIPLYNCDTDEVQIWERGKSFFKELAAYCSHTPNVSEVITEVTRSGKKGDTSTTYRLYEMKESDDFDMKNVEDDIPDILGTIILDKTAEDMEYYLDHGDFQNESSGEVTRRGNRDRDNSARESRRSNNNEEAQRRRPSSNRRSRDAEEDY